MIYRLFVLVILCLLSFSCSFNPAENAHYGKRAFNQPKKHGSKQSRTQRDSPREQDGSIAFDASKPWPIGEVFARFARALEFKVNGMYPGAFMFPNRNANPKKVPQPYPGHDYQGTYLNPVESLFFYLNDHCQTSFKEIVLIDDENTRSEICNDPENQPVLIRSFSANGHCLNLLNRNWSQLFNTNPLFVDITMQPYILHVNNKNHNKQNNKTHSKTGDKPSQKPAEKPQTPATKPGQNSNVGHTHPTDDHDQGTKTEPSDNKDSQSSKTKPSQSSHHHHRNYDGDGNSNSNRNYNYNNNNVPANDPGQYAVRFQDLCSIYAKN